MNVLDDTSDLAEALRRRYPELATVVAACPDQPIYVVGGAVRDLLLGRERSDLDLVLETDPLPVAGALGGATAEGGRFMTAKAHVDGLEIDLARARSERYPYPGALPVVAPAALAQDLARRDYSVNAIAVQVQGEPGGVIDPFDGRQDLTAGTLRLLHADSIRDDPTRALRGARYAAAYGLEPEPATLAQLTGTDLNAVSAQRRRADLIRIATAPQAIAAFQLLDRWGVLPIPAQDLETASQVEDLLEREPWRGEVERCEGLFAALPTVAAAADPEVAATAGGNATAGATANALALTELARTRPADPADAVRLAAGQDPSGLIVARARGAEWLDDYMARWRHVRLVIDGNDLIAAGINPGPELGQRLAVALRRKLNGEIEGREAELEAALGAEVERNDAPG